MNKKGRPRSFLLPLNLTFLCIILVLIGFEIYLRLSRTRVIPAGGATPFPLTADAELLIEHTPRGKRLVPGARVVIKNHRISGRDILMEINSLGFRDDEPIVPRPADEFRILVLGDSITWASYLPREETWVERMEEYLNRDIGGVSIEAINAGVGDIGLSEEIEILKEPGLAVEPDLVMVAFYLNDSRPPGGFPEEIGSRGWLRRHSQLAETVYRNLKLRSWIKERQESGETVLH